MPLILDALLVVLAQYLVDAPIQYLDDLRQVVRILALSRLTLHFHAVHHRVDHVHVFVELLLCALYDAN